MTTIQAGEPYELPIVQGELFLRGFRRKVEGVGVDLSAYDWAAQIRRKEAVTSDLLLDLTPHITLDDTDPTLLNLVLSGVVTRHLDIPKAGAFWDLFIWPTADSSKAVVMLQGTVSFDRATTLVPDLVP